MENKKSIKIPNWDECSSRGKRLTHFEYKRQGNLFFDWFKKFVDQSQLMYYDSPKFRKIEFRSPNSSGLLLRFSTNLASYHLTVRKSAISLCYVSDNPTPSRAYIIKDCYLRRDFEKQFRKYIKSPEYKALIKAYDERKKKKKA